MQKVIYDSMTLFPGDEVTDAFLELAARLATDYRTTPIKPSALTEDGSPVEVRMLIGPATTLSALTVDVPFDEPDNSLFVAEADRIRQIGLAHPVAGLENEELHFLEFEDQIL